MIPLIRGWRVRRDGDALVLTPPGGEDRERIRYVERQRPIMAPAAVARTLTWPHGATLVELSAPRAIVTDEGEYATLMTTELAHAGARSHGAIGVVHVDDFDAVLTGHASDPAGARACAALVEQLVRADRHYMPTRRRPYLHAAPAGWRPIDVDRVTTAWAPPDPADPRRITVLPAVPVGADDAAATLEAMAGIALSEIRTSLEPVRARGGLAGTRWAIARAAEVVELALLADDRFTYAACQVRGTTVADDTFAALLATIEPIPRDRHAMRAVDTFAHWAA